MKSSPEQFFGGRKLLLAVKQEDLACSAGWIEVLAVFITKTYRFRVSRLAVRCGVSDLPLQGPPVFSSVQIPTDPFKFRRRPISGFGIITIFAR